MRTPIGDENETKKVAFLFTSCKAENLKIIAVKTDQKWDVWEAAASLLQTTVKEKIYIKSE